MSVTSNKHVDLICLIIILITVVLAVLFIFGERLGLKIADKTMKYEQTLFDTSYVHQIDIVMDGWDSFIDGCEEEEYSCCTIVVDGEKYSNVAIRAKGNTSLSNVSSMNSQRYSFKVEFDHYDSTKTMDGLDKLCLNNLIQDNTMIKDYITYMLMKDFGVDTPLCSFVYITVNGEDWGLYLAVEGIEESFLTRNYGSSYGELYKPDSMSFGGGRGNGKDFNMDDFDFSTEDFDSIRESFENQINVSINMPSNVSSEMPSGFSSDVDIDSLSSKFDFNNINVESKSIGMGSDDVKLKYIDDDVSSYSNIFDNAKTDITTEDQQRLINSLKKLSSYEDLESVVNIDEVLRYFVVHNFVCNGDSYTGSMIHNYYLYEEDGQLSMIPWDYNLAFGTFQGTNASSTVNSSIYDPLSGDDVDDRPMLGWIFSSEEYIEKYNDLFEQFIEKWFSNGQLTAFIDETVEIISKYVEKDPTKFCTFEEFDAGITAIKDFVNLRAQAVENQLNEDNSVVNTSGLNLSDMGSMNNNTFNKIDSFDKSNFSEKTDIMQFNQIPDNSGFSNGTEIVTSSDNVRGNLPESIPDNGFDNTHENINFTDSNSNRKFSEVRKAELIPGAESNAQSNTNGALVLILSSILVLGVGLLIASKKKY